MRRSHQQEFTNGTSTDMIFYLLMEPTMLMVIEVHVDCLKEGPAGDTWMVEIVMKPSDDRMDKRSRDDDFSLMKD